MLINNLWIVVGAWALVTFAIYVILATTMTTALGAFTGALLVVSVSLFAAGFHIFSLGYKEAAIWTWGVSGFFLITGIITFVFFIKSLLKQKRRDDWDDSTKEGL